jgi:hypothetical protein
MLTDGEKTSTQPNDGKFGHQQCEQEEDVTSSEGLDSVSSCSGDWGDKLTEATVSLWPEESGLYCAPKPSEAAMMTQTNCGIARSCLASATSDSKIER